MNLGICRHLPMRTHHSAVRGIVLKGKRALGLVEPKHVILPVEIAVWGIRKLPVGTRDKLPLVVFDR